MSIRLLLVDDQTLFREGLGTLLAAQPDIDVVGEAANGEEALQLAVSRRPNVVLMDLRMPILDGVEATRRLHALQPDCHVIVLTTFDEDEYVFEGLRAGAVGYLLKDTSTDHLLEAIRAAARGESFLEPTVAAKVVAEFTRLSSQPMLREQPLAEPLTERELEILKWLKTDLSTREMAEHLVVSVNTIKTQLKSIYDKLDVHSREEALEKARALKMI
jgi:DNA-binding NarL/FixJ family response regulator